MLAGVDDHDPPAEETNKQSGRNQSASAEPPHDLKGDLRNMLYYLKGDPEDHTIYLSFLPVFFKKINFVMLLKW
jgi:hypothetical protein